MSVSRWLAVGDELDAGQPLAGYTTTVVVRKPQAEDRDAVVVEEGPVKEQPMVIERRTEMVNDDGVTELVEFACMGSHPFRETCPFNEYKQFPCKALLGMLETATRPIQRRVVRLLGDVPPEQLRGFVEEAFCQPETSPRTLVALARLLTSQSEQDEPLLSLGLKHVDARVRKACATKGASSTAFGALLIAMRSFVTARFLLTRE